MQMKLTECVCITNIDELPPVHSLLTENNSFGERSHFAMVIKQKDNQLKVNA